MINLDRFGGSFNTIDDTTSRICVPNKTENENLNVFHTISEINRPKSFKTCFM